MGAEERERRVRPEDGWSLAMVNLEARERFLEHLGRHGVISEAAKLAGFSTSTIRKWREQDEEFNEQCIDAMSQIVGEAEAVMVRIMRDAEHRDNYRAAEFILKSHDRSTYGHHRNFQIQIRPGLGLRMPRRAQPFDTNGGAARSDELPADPAAAAIEAAYRDLGLEPPGSAADDHPGASPDAAGPDA